MALLTCSGTGGGIYAKLANGLARYNCAQVSPPTIPRRYDVLHVVNKRIIAKALIEPPWLQIAKSPLYNRDLN